MKKFLTTTILMVVILLGGILGPFGVNAAPGDPIGGNKLPTDSGAFGGSTVDLQGTPSGQETTAGKADGKDKNAEQLQCGFANLKACLATLGDATMSLTARGLWVAGMLFDTSLGYSLNLNDTLSKLQVVDRAWAVGRDFANIFFIFILLFIAIATILQIEQYGAKALLAKVIIVAVLINFSLVITKVVIDTSNVVAISFYNQMTDNGATTISAKFMDGLKLESIYNAGERNNGTLKVTAGSETGVSQIITITVFGSLLILVSAFVFFAGTILFVARTVVLVFLMVLSPLAFLASVLPGTSQHSKKWWSMLFDQSFFAPAYIFLIFAVMLVISGGGVSKGQLVGEISKGGVPFSAALLGAGTGSLDIVFNFVVLIGMMIAALVVAKSMGAYGADTMMKWGEATRKAGQGFVGRHTIGRAAAVVAQAETTKRILGAVPGGRYVSQGLNIVAGASFGGAKGGYTSAVKKTAERQAAYGEYLGKGAGGADRQAAYVKSLEGGGALTKGMRTYTGIGSAGPQAAKMIEKNTAKQAAKKNKEAELAKLEEEHKKLEETPREKDETRFQELKTARTLTTNPGKLANINDEIAEINKRKERRIEVLNRINDLRDKLEMTEKIDKLSDEVGKKGGEAGGVDKGKSGK